jgi:hypothetical protein
VRAEGRGVCSEEDGASLLLYPFPFAASLSSSEEDELDEEEEDEDELESVRRSHCRDVMLSLDAFPQRWLRAWIPSRRRTAGASATTPLRLSVL